jgi:hypothetical protein
MPECKICKQPITFKKIANGYRPVNPDGTDHRDCTQEYRAQPDVDLNESLPGWHLTHKHLEEIRREWGAERHKLYVRLAQLERTLATANPGTEEFETARTLAETIRPIMRGY